MAKYGLDDVYYLGTFTFHGVKVEVYANPEGAGLGDFYFINGINHVGYGELIDGLQNAGVSFKNATYDELRSALKKEVYSHVIPDNL